MRPTTDDPTFTCAHLPGADPQPPTFHVGLAFCCAGCAADGPCTCSYDWTLPADAVERVEALGPVAALAIARGRLVGTAR